MSPSGHMSSNMPTQRQLRVGEQLRHVIVETLQKGKINHIDLMDMETITVSEVKASPDLKNATVYVISLGGGNMETIVPALNETASYFQKEIGQKLRLRSTPRLTFKVDRSFDNAEKIETLIRNAPTPNQSNESADHDTSDDG